MPDRWDSAEGQTHCIGDGCMPPHRAEGAAMTDTPPQAQDDLVAGRRPYRTWKCDKCGYEFDYFTYGGPCPGSEGQGCSGELHHRLTRQRDPTDESWL